MLNLKVVHKTAKALLLRDSGGDFWVPKAMIADGIVDVNDVFHGTFYENFKKTYKPGSVREDTSLMSLKPKPKPEPKELTNEEVREGWFSHVVSEFEVLSHIDEDDWFIKDFLGVS